MIIDDKGKLFGKVSVIDIFVVMIIVAAILGAWMKFGGSDTATTFSQKDKIHVTFYVESINDFVVDSIELGNIARDPSKNTNFGKVVKVDDGDAIIFTTNSDGEVLVSSKPGYKSVKIVVEGMGIISPNSILIDGTEYLVGKSFELRLGKSAAIWTRISDIEKVEE